MKVPDSAPCRCVALCALCDVLETPLRVTGQLLQLIWRAQNAARVSRDRTRDPDKIWAAAMAVIVVSKRI